MRSITCLVVETIEHWWNGKWGTLARREVWLRFNPAGPLWELEARETGRIAHAEYPSETAARAVLAPLVAGDGWRQLVTAG